MSFVDLHGSRIHFRMDGPRGAPVLVLSNSLGTDLSMWDLQVRPLSGCFQLLRYDSRGHGRSALPPGPCTVANLVEDVLGLLNNLGIERAHFCGLSIGGLVGMWLATHNLERVNKLILCNTAAAIGTPEFWDRRINAVRQGGIGSIAGALMERWFSRSFRLRSPELVKAMHEKLLATSPEGYIACCEAIRENNQRETAAGIEAPTLVIAGTRDAVTPPAESRFIADRIRHSRYAELDAGHLSNIERPQEFNKAVDEFLADEPLTSAG
jgi:3-oxoadipate enol-lactonase